MFRLSPYRRAAAALVAILASATLVGCYPEVDQRGHPVPADKLAEIHPGATTKQQVIKILGTPSSVGVFNDNSWYYISRRVKQVAFFDPDVLNQQVFIIRFNNDGVVQDVGHLTKANAREIEPAPGKTPSPGRELTFLEQIIGNVGRFNRGAGTAPSEGSGEHERPNGPVPNENTNGRPPGN
jgi:outer membrane protein assembly factor BamE (lipoprotein component of BamABCDE complex)